MEKIKYIFGLVCCLFLLLGMVIVYILRLPCGKTQEQKGSSNEWAEAIFTVFVKEPINYLYNYIKSWFSKV